MPENTEIVKPRTEHLCIMLGTIMSEELYCACTKSVCSLCSVGVNKPSARIDDIPERRTVNGKRENYSPRSRYSSFSSEMHSGTSSSEEEDLGGIGGCKAGV